METKFNSQICTTREQSGKLIAVGLKKETADMCIYRNVEFAFPCPDDDFIPAWSLHRLIEIGFHKGIGIVVSENAYDSIISLIEKRIQNGVFNKEYLNNENI